MLALLGFLGVVLTITALIHLYLWQRLVRDTTRRSSPWRRFGGFAVLGAAMLIPATIAGARLTGLRWLAWPGYLWLAVMFYLLVVLIVIEVPRLAATKWPHRRRVPNAAPPRPAPALVGAIDTGRIVAVGAGPVDAAIEDPPSAATDQPDDAPDPNRRLLLARGAAILAGVTATGIVGSGIRTALGPPVLDRVLIPLAKLPASMDGFRVALVADIHLGPLAGRRHIERIVATINRTDADVVAIVGDLVDGSVAQLGPAAAALRDLRSRHGSYFVTGNHEYYSGVEEWIAEVARLGVRPLLNERVAIGGLDLAGVNDLAGRDLGANQGPDFARTLDGRDPDRPVVLLAHQPVQAHEAAKYGVDLQLSGHTHGGQIVPFNLLVRLEQPIVSGYGVIDGTKVYVTNGAGFWGPPVRVGAPPQVTLVELRSA